LKKRLEKDFTMSDKEMFEKFKKTILEKSRYHQEQRDIYEGKLSARTLGIALDADLERRISTNVDYARIAVNNLAARQNFDAFRNDEVGFTRLLVRSNALLAIKSGILNSQISSCAAVSVLPQDISSGELPVFTAYTGAEFTGKYNARNGALEYGMVVNAKNPDGTPKDYLFFKPGHVMKLDKDGKLILDIEMPTKRMLLVPFVYDQDLAYRPFGEARINRSAISALKSALVINMLLAASREHRVGNIHMLILDKAYSEGIIDETAFSDLTSKMGTVNMVSTPADAKLVQMAGIPTDELQKLFTYYITQFAAAVEMPPSLFGIQPSNGSFSEGAMAEMNRPYNSILDGCRDSYGLAIKNLALAGMALLTQEDPDWEDIEPVWKEPRNQSIFGTLGDGVGKMKTAEPSVDLTDFIREALGTSIRAEAMKVGLPNFDVEVTREIAAKYKELAENPIEEPAATAAVKKFPTPFDIRMGKG
jgi:hypothetical protein